jgi:hypothetical protein
VPARARGGAILSGMAARASVRPAAIALTLLSAVCLYSMLRIGALMLFPPDPRMLALDAPAREHAAYFWRIATAAYGAGLLAPLWLALAARRPTAAAHVLETLVVASATLLVGQALIFP